MTLNNTEIELSKIEVRELMFFLIVHESVCLDSNYKIRIEAASGGMGYFYNVKCQCGAETKITDYDRW